MREIFVEEPQFEAFACLMEEKYKDEDEGIFIKSKPRWYSWAGKFEKTSVLDSRLRVSLNKEGYNPTKEIIKGQQHDTFFTVKKTMKDLISTGNYKAARWLHELHLKSGKCHSNSLEESIEILTSCNAGTLEIEELMMPKANDFIGDGPLRVFAEYMAFEDTKPFMDINNPPRWMNWGAIYIQEGDGKSFIRKLHGKGITQDIVSKILKHDIVQANVMAFVSTLLISGNFLAAKWFKRIFEQIGYTSKEHRKMIEDLISKYITIEVSASNELNGGNAIPRNENNNSLPMQPKPEQKPAEVEEANKRSPSGSPRKAENENSIAERMLCVICLENEKSHAMEPCGHLCVCEGCSEEIPVGGQCPMCRANVTKKRKIFV